MRKTIRKYKNLRLRKNTAKLPKNVMKFVTKKPARTIGVASLVTAFVLGAIYAKMRFFNHH